MNIKPKNKSIKTCQTVKILYLVQEVNKCLEQIKLWKIAGFEDIFPKFPRVEKDSDYQILLQIKKIHNVYRTKSIIDFLKFETKVTKIKPILNSICKKLAEWLVGWLIWSLQSCLDTSSIVYLFPQLL